ncbi:MAG TPA: MBL fold metallo-hydrolase [Thermomicrobiaceae bacterium]|nr:MBL fold metallo-hydrolase [Thermomicrobiaceae bacterium]
MRVTCLASGSSGNCLLVQSGATHVLLDAGVGVRVARRELAARGVADHELSAILISHEHNDHVRALPSLLSYQRAAVLGTRGTISALQSWITAEYDALTPGLACQIGELRVTPVRVSHDAAEPVGFVFEAGATRVAVFTDLGGVDTDVAAAVAGAALVVLESNYDEQMLARGNYPAHLKRRIRGPHGHLSNADCATFLAAHLSFTTSDVWLAHLSQNNNRPPLARTTTQTSLGPGGPQVHTLPRHGAPVNWDSSEATTRPRQLNLF